MSRERPPAQASARSFGARSLRTQSALRGQGETGPAQTAPRPPQPTLQSPRKARGYLGPSRDPGAGPAGGGLSRHDLCPKLKPMPRYADAKGRSACSRCPQRSVRGDGCGEALRARSEVARLPPRPSLLGTHFPVVAARDAIAVRDSSVPAEDSACGRQCLRCPPRSHARCAACLRHAHARR